MIAVALSVQEKRRQRVIDWIGEQDVATETACGYNRYRRSFLVRPTISIVEYRASRARSVRGMGQPQLPRADQSSLFGVPKSEQKIAAVAS